ncbi:RING-H2 finger protein ATL66-like [Carica papaya]|uniref:RING-H2 finger protein ATL66-like n=1 Tax=Carica papaya TaxID=3649 RepID=UPI000B8C9929|nr:RING-H2 finger protein ATL66-like [Carica papaya]
MASPPPQPPSSATSNFQTHPIFPLFFPLALITFVVLLFLFVIFHKFIRCCSDSTEPDIEQGVSSTLPHTMLLLFLHPHLLPAPAPQLPRRPQATPFQSSGEAQSSIPGAGSSVFVYKSDVVLGNLNEECVICLEGFADGEECKILNDCNHGYHKPCVDKWLKIHNQCPLCRSSVAGGSFRVSDTATPRQ